MQRKLTCFITCVLVVLVVAGCDEGNIAKEDSENPASPNAIEGAATSESGAVTPDNPKITYSAGPFTVPNVTGTTGEVQCGTATPCHEYSLTVTTPPGYGADHNMRIQVEWSNSAADFDVYVFDGSGNSVGTAASTADPETVIIPPTSGNYIIRVVPYAPLGESFTGTIELMDKPSNPPPSDAEPPGFTNYAAPERLPNAHDAGEPSIGINYNTGSVMYQAGLSTYRVKFDDRSNPAPASWKDVSAALPECTAETSLDPILFTDHETGRTLESQLAANPAINSLTCYTDNDGDSWTVSQGGGIGSGVDHQTIGGGPFADNGIGPVTEYPNAVYYCSQDVATALCAVSRDGGLTFGAAVPIYTLDECGGLHGHVKVGPQGVAYVPNGSCNGSQGVVVSTDNGTNWTVRPNPESTPAVGSDPGVEVGANGTVYLGYQNGDAHARAAISHDHGQTWLYDQDVGAQLGIENIVFPKVIAGDDDRAAFAFLGTTTPGDYEAADFDGVWHLYVATTYDGGVSWVTVDATPNDPVQRGSICTGGTTCGDDRNLLDFIGIDVDREGRVLVAYADGCTGNCVASGPNNFDALATIARQSSGKGLYAAYDKLEADLTVTEISASQSTNKKNTTVTATISNEGEADAQNVLVRFFDGTTQIGEATVDLAAGSTTQSSINWDTQKEKGDHTIIVVVDANDAVSESNEANNKMQKEVTLR